MDRLSQLREEAGCSRDSTLDTSSPPSETYMTANESSSKYFTLSEVDSTFDISPTKDDTLASTTAVPDRTITDTERLISNLSPIGKKSDLLGSYKIGKQIEASTILSGGVNIFDDNDNSYDGDELVIDDNVDVDEKANTDLSYEKTDNLTETALLDADTAIPSKDTEVALQIDGKNVDAIDIGNGLYLYRKEGEEELAAVQIIDDDQHQPSFKFLKVRENAEGNLEVYEEIEIEVPKEVPAKEGKTVEKNTSHVPIKDINKVFSDQSGNKVTERRAKTPQKESSATALTNKAESDSGKDSQTECKTEVNWNGKMMKVSDARKSPLIGTFTPMTFHSTPNKEGIPLTKTMVDQQLHPNRHSDNVKKTIEVHTDSSKQKLFDTPTKNKDLSDDKISSVKQVLCEKASTASENNEGTQKSEESIERADGKLNKKGENTQATEESGVISSEKEKEVVVAERLLKENTLKENTNKGLDNKNKDGDDMIKKENNKSDEDNLCKKDVIIDSTNEIKSSKNPQTTLEKQSETLEKQSKDTVEGNKISEKINTEKEIRIDNSHMEKSVKINKISEEKSINLNKSLEKSDKTCEDKQVNANTKNNENSDKVCKEINKQDVKKLSIKTPEKRGDIEQEREGEKPERVGKNQDGEDKKQDREYRKQEEDKKQQGEDKKHEGQDKKQEGHGKNHDGEEKPEKEAKSIKVDVTNEAELIPKDLTSSLAECKTKESNKTDNQDCVSKKQKQEKDTVVSTKKDYTKIVETSIQKCLDQPLLKEIKQGNVTCNTQVENPIENIEESVDKAKESDSKLKEPEKESIKISQPVENVNFVQETIIQISQDSENKKEKAETTSTQTSDDIKVLKEVKSKTSDPNKNEHKNTEMVNESIVKKDIVKIDKVAETNLIQKSETNIKKDVKAVTSVETKPKSVSNNHAAVPFGKWTEANRQEFLNKIKEAKIPINASNANQIKQPNDLNRRDILKKIDSQRQSNNASSKTQDLHKLNVKKETAFASKNTTHQESKIPVKTEANVMKNKQTLNKKIVKQESTIKPQTETSSMPANIANISKKEMIQRKEINNQDLIDKTIEGIINKAIPVKHNQEDSKQNAGKQSTENQMNPTLLGVQPNNKSPSSLDDIEMKMNELHGIPFIERPPHELPQVHNLDSKILAKPEVQNISVNKINKIPNLLPLTNKSQQKTLKDNVLDVDSEEEIIEHEPITGDIDLVKKNVSQTVPVTENLAIVEPVAKHTNNDTHKKGAIITEKDFDKFARRNSITYEDCLTVNFDGKETHNVVQTVIEKDVTPKKYNRNEILLAEAKAKSPHKQNIRHNNHPNRDHAPNKFTVNNEDACNKTKLQIAYQSALTAKRQLEGPITVIEDKPVKVLFMDSDVEFLPRQLNVQGQELSPVKKPLDSDAFTASTCDSVDSDILDSIDDGKLHEEAKTKTKHQRKQVLTPVDTPELELIEPSDLGIEVSPKKKRKIEDSKTEKMSKSLVPKKSYLLGRNMVTEEKLPKPQELTKNPCKEITRQSESHIQKDTVSAIDNLVKAAELLETQSNNTLNTSASSQTSNSQQNTPVKRGRGRPRKYPLPEGTPDRNQKVPTPQKKPRFIDVKEKRPETSTEEDTTDDEIIKENWTMGKINENIVCPICNKLFRSENVVFKHVKHCTGPSPNRSDSDKKSPRRMRHSQDFETKSRGSKSDDTDETEKDNLRKDRPKKRKSKDSKSNMAIDDVIVIEDTPVKEKPEKCDDIINERREHKSRKTIATAKLPRRSNSLMCEICGKIFRQLSYLVSHKMMHKREDTPKHGNDTQTTNRSIFNCEVCQKEFRKLHHLVQHRLIHNRSSAVSSRLNRKSSSEQNDNKSVHLKKHDSLKETEDQSAGFRCEPCDKSFRKLHHLVEHRETHDGINRQKNTSNTQIIVEKPVLPPQCDICKKTFRKLHHLIEHKEQHLETSSETDDKSVKSSLSTKDIIHECPLCYMVFPNEHSLNKHTIICQRKKRQSTAKQAKQTDENQIEEESCDTLKTEENKIENDDEPKLTVEEKVEVEKSDDQIEENLSPPISEKVEEVLQQREETPEKQIEVQPVDLEILPLEDEDIIVPEKPPIKPTSEINIASEILAKIKKMECKEIAVSRKKTSVKERLTSMVTKRQKSTNQPLPVVDKVAPVESSDDDEVRYMLNPDYKIDVTIEGKLFMKVRAKKRNSLQIERPNSKNLNKRRASLQHPPKIPRLKPKAIETRNAPINPAGLLKNVAKLNKSESVPATDSDDSDVKYSFPKVSEKTPKPSLQASTSKVVEKKTPRKSLAEKRKSLSGIAKRKLLGKAVTARHKVTPSPVKQVKKRTTDVEHRCDCGQLFSSAALLSRHTTLAHTPPRIRRRRSPPPEPEIKADVKINTKPALRKLSAAEKTKQSVSRKSSVKSDTSNSNMNNTKTIKKRGANSSDSKSPIDTRKSVKAGVKSEAVKVGASGVKLRRSAAHRGVPVPEKMRKLMEKSKK